MRTSYDRFRIATRLFSQSRMSQFVVRVHRFSLHSIVVQFPGKQKQGHFRRRSPAYQHKMGIHIPPRVNELQRANYVRAHISTRQSVGCQP